jgi:hypothetical protein
MSPAAVNGLVLAFIVLLTLLLALALLAVILSSPVLTDAAELELGRLMTRFEGEVSADAKLRAGTQGRSQVTRNDIRVEFRERVVRKTPRVFIGVTRYGKLIISGTGFAVIIPSIPHVHALPAGLTKVLPAAGIAVASIAMIYDSSESLHGMFERRRARKNRAISVAQPGHQPPSTTSPPAIKELARRGARLARAVKEAARGLTEETEITETEITADKVSEAWQQVVRPRPVFAPVVPAAQTRRAWALVGSAAVARAIILFAALYFIFLWAKDRLPSGQYWPLIVIIAALLVVYLALLNVPRVAAAAWKAWKRLDALGAIGSWIARPEAPSRTELTSAGRSSPVPAGSSANSGYVMGSTMPNQGSQSPVTPTAPPPGSTFTPGSMFSVGWLMARLFGARQQPIWPPPSQAGGTPPHLPAVAELDPEHQVQVAVAELQDLLSVYFSLSAADVMTAWESGNAEAFAAAVTALHLELLMQLAANPGQSNAYQLGRALSDACWLPSQAGPDFFLREFGRNNLATLQTWLTQAGDALAALPAAAVSRSLENWQDWADVNASPLTSNWSTAHEIVVTALRTQGQAWRAQLAGQADSSGPISPDAWVHAGQSMLRTSRTLTLTAVRRFWPIMVVVAAATGGLLYLAIANSTGTARVWTSLATVAAALGVTGASVRAAAIRAASGIEHDISQAASLDARAWSITWLPTMPQSRLRRYRLARRGVDAPHIRARLELPDARPSTIAAP